MGRCEKGSQSGVTGDQDAVRGVGHSLKHTAQHIPLAFYWLFFFVALLLQKTPRNSNFNQLLLPARHKSVSIYIASKLEVDVESLIMGLGTLYLTLGEFQ